MATGAVFGVARSLGRLLAGRFASRGWGGGKGWPHERARLPTLPARADATPPPRPRLLFPLPFLRNPRLSSRPSQLRDYIARPTHKRKVFTREAVQVWCKVDDCRMFDLSIWGRETARLRRGGGHVRPALSPGRPATARRPAAAALPAAPPDRFPNPPPRRQSEAGLECSAGCVTAW